MPIIVGTKRLAICTYHGAFLYVQNGREKVRTGLLLWSWGILGWVWLALVRATGVIAIDKASAAVYWLPGLNWFDAFALASSLAGVESAPLS